MIKLKSILNESVEDYIKVYHGGKKWSRWDASVSAPKKGRYEAGAGIYTTTNYETAQKYGRGSNVVSIVYVDKDITLADAVDIPIEDAVNFVKLYIGTKNRRDFLDAIQKSYDRMGRLPAFIMLNMSVNLEIGGKQAMEVMKFVVEHGVDASLQSQSGEEEWLVIHNPEIIKKVVHTKPSDISIDDYMLPKVSSQITS